MMSKLKLKEAISWCEKERHKHNFDVIAKMDERELLRLRDCLAIIEAMGIKPETNSRIVHMIYINLCRSKK